MSRGLHPDTAQKIRASIIVIIPLVATLLAIVLLWGSYVFTRDIVILIVMNFFTSIGVTVGYHRLLTHEGFHCPDWFRAILVTLGCMAWEGTPLQWASTHVKHHAHSDEEEDPHTPLHGFWHAHMGWLYQRKNFPDPQVYVPHLVSDPVIRWVDQWALLWMAIALLIPYLAGGWTGLLWGGFVRIFLTTHVTWSVNSVCHTFGKRAFETTDESRNHWVIGLLGFGEGWHNNHHAFPRSAFHGLHWWQFDLSGLLIRLWERTGLVWDVQRVAPEILALQRAQLRSTRESLVMMRSQIATAVMNADVELQRIFSASVDRTLSDGDRARLSSVHHSARQRLSAIRDSVSQRTHVKKAKLLVHAREVHDVVLHAKQQAAALLRSKGLAA
ncbi:MAG: stearoyl-CoA desaturase (delta-9 desaturase) [Candidatus Peregrinibacteria bacterium Gr01-1014_25]|nr:MAG: stearoyl-CoA desaturase (delta-9 desaturase) [Candidatus Peregrinibacteria bacterium Gr01-1014_25]